MKSLTIFLFYIFVSSIYAPPVRKASTGDPAKVDILSELHYKTYLEEIIKELEKDQEFSNKIKDAQGHNRTQHIAQSLNFVNHNIRNMLDEIKRREIDRLNLLESELERRKLEASGKKVPPPNSNLEKILSVDREHMDHKNVHSFEVADLEKLILKAEEDLTFVDKKQEQQYKEHEMKKEYLKKKKLENTKDAGEKKKVEMQFQESEQRHKDHPKVNHPGSEEQLKEVWAKTDHLDPKEFDIKAFFSLHDVNGDGHLDINEVESLMQNELSKVYNANNTDDDMQEKYHEMMRMRSEMMLRMDSNKDKMISKEEFIKYTSTEGYKDISDWKTQEEESQKPYSNKEYTDFEDEYGHDGEEEDDFSDLDESLRYVPKKAAGMVSQEEIKTPNQNSGSVSMKTDSKPDSHQNSPQGL